MWRQAAATTAPRLRPRQAAQSNSWRPGKTWPTSSRLCRRPPEPTPRTLWVVYFTTPHFDGYPMVLVQLAAIEATELRELITDAWLAQAPKTLVKTFLAGDV
jgi:hypothetical protein